jgi:hypothetical protein
MPDHAADFDHRLGELNQMLTRMSDDEKLLVLLSSTEELMALYRCVTAVNAQFHHRLETGTLPMTPTVGHA